MFFSPHELMAIHGFDPLQLNMSCMSWVDGVALAGEGMALPTVALVMLPCLAELGFLIPV